ncbi:MAG: hypothetical protein OXJ52_04375 [Oligoflexia bacterium]|nr:hypothetical protein [Oligoflexia bacterium]
MKEFEAFIQRILSYKYTPKKKVKKPRKETKKQPDKKLKSSPKTNKLQSANL